jgi:hypothetical protein
MEKQDMELANKLNSDLSMAIESGTAMAGKMKNSNLKNYLFSHVEKYEDLQKDLQKVVSTSNKKLKNTNIISRAFLWMQVQLSSFRKSDESDYIESFIKGSEMGIESSTHLLNKYNDANKKLKDIAFNLQAMEIENIDKLKDYMKRSDYL